MTIKTKGYKTTWSKRTKKWLKQYVGSDYDDIDKRTGRQRILDNLRSRKSHFSSETSKAANKYNIRESQIKYVIHKVNNRKIRIYTRLRCNLVRWLPALANAKRIPQVFRNKCFMCGGSQENIEHFLTNCRSLSEIRNRFASKLPVLACSRTNSQGKVSKLLGNIDDLKENPERVEELRDRIDFLSEIYVARAVILKRKLDELDRTRSE